MIYEIFEQCPWRNAEVYYFFFFFFKTEALGIDLKKQSQYALVSVLGTVYSVVASSTMWR